MKKKNVRQGFLPYLFLIIFMIVVYVIFSSMNKKVNKLTYDEFISDLNENKIEEIEIIPKSRANVYSISGKLKGYDENETFTLSVPLSDSIIADILKVKDDDKLDFKVKTQSDPENSTLVLILAELLPIVIIVGIGVWFFSRQVNVNSKSIDFGRSKARLANGEGGVTFKDVAGLDEEKEEVSELIDFLKAPKKFQEMGARIPKGVLLVGPPGTGKTLLAKAVAGEANVPFYYISGSDFVELFVGIGASRVRDMFKQAKQNAPCLIFIDEIDAVGRQRGSGIGGGHDEREQTLNQLLTEMDGFGTNEGIIVIAATNRADVLDPALLRPGRFDRQVIVNLPDIKGREEILGVHARNKVLGRGVTLSNLAKRTPGFSGADSEQEKKMVAFHEAGHAVIGIKLSNASEVQKVTIIPRGQAGGYNLMIPKEETYTSTKSELIEQITGLLGGRVAEEITFGEISTGAHNDLEKATKIARSMVTEYGMSDLGLVQLEQRQGEVFLGRDYTKSRNFSNEVAHEIDIEMNKIMSNCYEQAKKILSEEKELLSLIANSLLEYETLTKEQIEYLVENGHMPEVESLSDFNLTELKTRAKEAGIKGYNKMNKDEFN